MKMTKEGLPQIIFAIRVLLCRENGDVLLIKRSDNIDNPGIWEFPGGKFEGGRSLKNAAIREVAEETGLSISVDRQPIYYWDSLSDLTTYEGYHYICLVLRGSLTYISREPIDVKLNPEEHQNYRWMNLYNNDNLEELEMLAETQMALDLFIRTYLR